MSITLGILLCWTELFMELVSQWKSRPLAGMAGREADKARGREEEGEE